MPWEVPITVDGFEYPTRFNTDQEPTQEDIDEAVKQITSKRTADKPFLDVSDTLSATGRAVTSLGTTVPSSLSQAWAGLDNPWKRSEGYLQSQQGMRALQEEMAAANATAAAEGDASSVSSAIREATPSLGFSGATLAPSLAVGAGTVLATRSPAAARGAAAATSAVMAYRMAGAQFLDDARDRINSFFQENFQRLPTEQEQEEAYQEILPLARKFGAAEAGPEALGNLALGGAGKYIRRALGGKGGVMELATGALGKITGAKATAAGVGAAVGEIATEAVTKVEQDRVQKQFEEGTMLGKPASEVAIPDRTLGDYTQAFTDVAPTTLALTGLMGAAGLGPTAISKGYNALRTPTVATPPPAQPASNVTADVAENVSLSDEGEPDLAATENVRTPVTLDGQNYTVSIPPGSSISPDALAGFYDDPKTLQALHARGDIRLEQVIAPTETVDTTPLNNNIAASAPFAPQVVTAMKKIADEEAAAEIPAAEPPAPQPAVTPAQETPVAPAESDGGSLGQMTPAAGGSSPDVTAATVPQEPVVSSAEIAPADDPFSAEVVDNTATMAQDGGVTTRDTTKPEQMTPEEFEADSKLFNAAFAPELDGKGPQMHRKLIEEAAPAFNPYIRKPVSAATVDAYGIKLPEGYVKQGDLYIFRPAAPQPAAPQPAAPQPAAPQPAAPQPAAPPPATETTVPQEPVVSSAEIAPADDPFAAEVVDDTAIAAQDGGMSEKSEQSPSTTAKPEQVAGFSRKDVTVPNFDSLSEYARDGYARGERITSGVAAGFVSTPETYFVDPSQMPAGAVMDRDLQGYAYMGADGKVKYIFMDLDGVAKLGFPPDDLEAQVRSAAPAPAAEQPDIKEPPQGRKSLYQIRAAQGRPATDADGVPTGWKINEFRDGIELVSEDASKYVIFPIENQSSYGDKMRALIAAENWAIDNPVRTQIEAAPMEANYGAGRVEDVTPGIVEFIHTTKTTPGKGQESGYYPGTYAYETESGFLPSMEGNKFTGKLPENHIYTLKNADRLKKDAAEAGFGMHSGNGNAEVDYLRSLGFKAIRRPAMGGTEIVVFDAKDANFQPASGQPELGAGATTTPQGAVESPTSPLAGNAVNDGKGTTSVGKNKIVRFVESYPTKGGGTIPPSYVAEDRTDNRQTKVKNFSTRKEAEEWLKGGDKEKTTVGVLPENQPIKVSRTRVFREPVLNTEGKTVGYEDVVRSRETTITVVRQTPSYIWTSNGEQWAKNTLELIPSQTTSAEAPAPKPIKPKRPKKAPAPPAVEVQQQPIEETPATPTPLAGPLRPKFVAGETVSFKINGQPVMGTIQRVSGGGSATVTYNWNGKKEQEIVLRTSEIQRPVLAVAEEPNYKYTQEQNARKAARFGLPTEPGVTVGAGSVIKNALARIASDTAMPQMLRAVARALQNQNYDGVDLRIEADGRRWYAGYYLNDNGITEIGINLRLVGRGQVDAISVLLHEALHHVTLAKVRDPQGEIETQAVEALDTLRKRIKVYAGLQQKATKFSYELGTVDEFITALFTRPDFQDFIAGIPDTFTPGTPGSKFRSVLSEVFRTIAQLVTGQKVQKGGIMDQAFASTLALFETPQRAARGQSVDYSMAEERDAEYMAAVEAGDMEKAQRMVDEAAKAAGYNVGPVWHGSPDEEFTIFQKPERDADEDGFWFSKDREWASKFGPTRLFYIKNAKTWGGDDFVVKEPNSIKSADPVTRDDAGNVIPLSQRFQPTSPDIRFSATDDTAAEPVFTPDEARAILTKRFGKAVADKFNIEVMAPRRMGNREVEVDAELREGTISLNLKFMGSEELLIQKAEHEMAHAVFSDKGVQDAWRELSASMPPDVRTRITERMKQAGYDPRVLNEEVLVRFLEEVRANTSPSKWKAFMDAVIDAFRRFFGAMPDERTARLAAARIIAAGEAAVARGLDPSKQAFGQSVATPRGYAFQRNLSGEAATMRNLVVRRPWTETVRLAREIIDPYKKEDPSKDKMAGREKALRRLMTDTDIDPNVRTAGLMLLALEADTLASVAKNPEDQARYDDFANIPVNAYGVLESSPDPASVKLESVTELMQMGSEAGRRLNSFKLIAAMSPDGFVRRQNRVWKKKVNEATEQQFGATSVMSEIEKLWRMMQEAGATDRGLAIAAALKAFMPSRKNAAALIDKLFPQAGIRDRMTKGGEALVRDFFQMMAGPRDPKGPLAEFDESIQSALSSMLRKVMEARGLVADNQTAQATDIDKLVRSVSADPLRFDKVAAADAAMQDELAKIEDDERRATLQQAWEEATSKMYTNVANDATLRRAVNAELKGEGVKWNEMFDKGQKPAAIRAKVVDAVMTKVGALITGQTDPTAEIAELEKRLQAEADAQKQKQLREQIADVRSQASALKNNIASLRSEVGAAFDFIAETKRVQWLAYRAGVEARRRVAERRKDMLAALRNRGVAESALMRLNEKMAGPQRPGAEPNPVTTLIGEHIKTPVDGFIDKLVALGVEKETAEALDAISGKMRADLAEQAKASSIDSAVRRLAEKLAGPPRPGRPANAVADLVNKQVREPMADFSEKLAALGATQTDIDLLVSLTDKVRVDNLERKLFNSLKPKTRAAKSAIPRLLRVLLEAGKTGAFDSKAFNDALGEAFDLPPMTAEQEAEIKRMVTEINKLPQGAARVDKQQELQNYVALVQGVPARDMLLSAWYANVLSGISTQLIGLVGNSMNTALRSAFLAVTSPRDFKNYLRGALGVGKDAGIEEVKAAMKGRGMLKVGRLDSPEIANALEVLFRKGPTTPAEWVAYIASGATRLRMVFRIMGAIDAFFWNSAREGMYHLAASRTVRKMAKEKGMTEEEANAEFIRQLGGGPEAYEAALKDAEAALTKAGQPADMATMDRMAREAIDKARAEINPAAVQAANRWADRMVLQQEPEGVGKIISALIKAVQSLNVAGFPLGQMLVPFNKIVSNLFEQSLDYTGLGIVRAALGMHISDARIDWSRKGIPGIAPAKGAKVFDEVEARERRMAGFVGLTLSAAAYVAAKANMDDDDDEVPFMITAFGPTDKNKREQMPDGWVPFSIKIGDTYYRYAEWPLGMVLAGFGAALDAERYGNMKEKDTLDRIGYSAMLGLKGFMTQGVLSSVDTAIDVLMFKATGKKYTDIPVNAAKGLIPAQGFLRDVSGLFDNTKVSNDDIASALMKDIPVVKSWGTKPELNVFGEPTLTEGEAVLRRFLTQRRPHAEADYLTRNKLYIPGMDETVTIGQYLPPTERDRFKRRAMQMQAMENGVFTPEQNYNFRKRAGELTKAAVERIMKQAPAIRTEEQRKAVQNLIDKQVGLARRRAMVEAVPYEAPR